MVELLRTQGLWLQSLRLAYQQCKGRVAEEGADKVPLAKDQDLEAGFPPCQPPSMLQLQVLCTPPSAPHTLVDLAVSQCCSVLASGPLKNAKCCYLITLHVLTMTKRALLRHFATSELNVKLESAHIRCTSDLGLQLSVPCLAGLGVLLCRP